jgi:hypothetical protein
VAIAQSRQDISVPVGRWVGQAKQGVQDGVGQAQQGVQNGVGQAQQGVQGGVNQVGAGVAEIGRVPGNIWSSVTGIFGLFG